VKARPVIAPVVSLSPQRRLGIDTTRLCIRATGRELVFINMDAAMAKFLWDRFNLNTQPKQNATIIDAPVTRAKKRGMIHNSRNIAGERKRAIFEKRRAGVNRVTLI